MFVACQGRTNNELNQCREHKDSAFSEKCVEILWDFETDKKCWIHDWIYKSKWTFISIIG